jgi:hypothetical protein
MWEWGGGPQPGGEVWVKGGRQATGLLAGDEDLYRFAEELEGFSRAHRFDLLS